MSSDFLRTLRRVRPHKRQQPLERRANSDLAMVGTSPEKPRALLYDTTVYVDILQGRFPASGETMLRAADAWHSTVTEAELAAACALLDPSHRGTPRIVKEIARVLDRRPPHRTIAPDRQIWREAGIVAGTLARLQRISRTDRPRLINDALIFATARKHGHTVLTRNIRDFDWLQQLSPAGRVLFYQV